MDLANFIKILDNNTNDTLQLAKSCSASQLNFCKSESWSILQILEHICNADKIIFYIISRPSVKISESTELVGDASLKKILIEQRGQKKYTAPDILEPKGNIPDLESFEKLFLEQRNSLKQDIQTKKLIIDNRIHSHPIMGEMTISDWLNFLVNHTQRHLEQIKDTITALETQKR
jgi:uncharacterized damage-inducible protein DinB